MSSVALRVYQHLPHLLSEYGSLLLLLLLLLLSPNGLSSSSAFLTWFTTIPLTHLQCVSMAKPSSQARAPSPTPHVSSFPSFYLALFLSPISYDLQHT